MARKIFESAKLGRLAVKNRLIRSGTWEGMAPSDGSVTDDLLQKYTALAEGGAGTIVTGFTSVADEDAYCETVMRLSNDVLIPRYRELADAVHARDCRIMAQLALGGFFRKTGSASEQIEIDDMSADDIEHAVCQFGAAAGRAARAGFDGVQIHAAHFSFLSRFISPLHNHRRDAYGGSTEGRSRILLEVLREIRKNAPALHVSMKLNISDQKPGGLEPQESFRIAEMMADAGLESVEVSATDTAVTHIKAGVNEAYFYDFGKPLAERIAIPVILVGGHRSLEHMEVVLNDSRVEFLSMARPLIREPDLPNRWLGGDTAPARCVSCNACFRTPNHDCVFVLKGKK